MIFPGRWTVEPEFIGTPAGEAFSSLDKCFAVDGEQITQDPISQVVVTTVAGKRYYVKRYNARGKGFSKWLGPRKARGEWRNLLLFRKMGLAVPPIVAYGKRGQRGVLVTEEVANTVDLSDLADQNAPQLKDPNWIKPVIEQVAEGTRKMHQHRFAHNDLKWRNLLVTMNGDPKVYFIDCPSGRTWCWPFLEYRIIKDIACLDKVAKYHLSESERKYFYQVYSGRQTLNQKDKKRIEKILKFFEGRE